MRTVIKQWSPLDDSTFVIELKTTGAPIAFVVKGLMEERSDCSVRFAQTSRYFIVGHEYQPFKTLTQAHDAFEEEVWLQARRTGYNNALMQAAGGLYALERLGSAKKSKRKLYQKMRNGYKKTLAKLRRANGRTSLSALVVESGGQ